MSDLIISTTGISAPPEACTEAPPSIPARGDPPEDPCHIELPLVEDTALSGPIRRVRFDRHGDSFVLSPANSLDIREWFESHPNTPQFFSELRFLNNILRVPPVTFRAGSMHVLLILAQYVIGGRVREASEGVELGVDTPELGRGLLEMFADTREDLLGPFLGQLQVVRRGAWLREDALDRLRWVTSMLDHVSEYRQFRLQLINEADLAGYEEVSEDRRQLIQDLIDFSGAMVVQHAMHRPMHYDARLLEAHDAYRDLYQSEISSGSRQDFCTALEAALRQLRGEPGDAELPFIAECRQAIELRDREPEDAFRETFRNAFLSPTGQGVLQSLIEEESDDADMSIDWLAERGDAESGGRIGELVAIVMRHLEVHVPDSSEGLAEISVNVPLFRAELQTLLEAHSVNHREYLLAAIAVLRRLAGREGDQSTVRVFVRDLYQEIGLAEENRAELRSLLSTMEGQQETSQERSDIWLPILEGAVCAVGIGGLFATEYIPELHGDEGPHLGLGGTSAGLAGAGCTSLLGHFIWPEIGEVHNHYLWDGITGLAGAAVGVGLYFLLQLALGGAASNPGMRFPVDEYGP